MKLIQTRTPAEQDRKNRKHTKQLVDNLVNDPKAFKYIFNLTDKDNSIVSKAASGTKLVGKGIWDVGAPARKLIVQFGIRNLPSGLLRSGLLENLLSIEATKAKAILAEIIKSSISQKYGTNVLEGKDVVNLSSLVDKTFTLLSLVKNDGKNITNLSNALADILQDPPKTPLNIIPIVELLITFKDQNIQTATKELLDAVKTIEPLLTKFIPDAKQLINSATLIAPVAMKYVANVASIINTEKVTDVITAYNEFTTASFENRSPFLPRLMTTGLRLIQDENLQKTILSPKNLKPLLDTVYTATHKDPEITAEETQKSLSALSVALKKKETQEMVRSLLQQVNDSFSSDKFTAHIPKSQEGSKVKAIQNLIPAITKLASLAIDYTKEIAEELEQPQNKIKITEAIKAFQNYKEISLQYSLEKESEKTINAKLKFVSKAIQVLNNDTIISKTSELFKSPELISLINAGLAPLKNNKEYGWIAKKLDGKACVKLLQKVTTKKGLEAVSNLLENPSGMAFIKVIYETKNFKLLGKALYVALANPISSATTLYNLVKKPTIEQNSSIRNSLESRTTSINVPTTKSKSFSQEQSVMRH